MTNPPAAALDEAHGFIRAHCQACGRSDVWLQCNQCKKSDRFLLTEEAVVCRCGATYSFATCTCGEPVPLEHLEWVHFQKGPASLAEWEWDPRRLALLGAALVALILAGVALWVL